MEGGNAGRGQAVLEGSGQQLEETKAPWYDPSNIDASGKRLSRLYALYGDRYFTTDAELVNFLFERVEELLGVIDDLIPRVKRQSQTIEQLTNEVNQLQDEYDTLRRS